MLKLEIERQKKKIEEAEDAVFQEMFNTAARWRSAVMKLSRELMKIKAPNDLRKATFNNLTTQGKWSAYLMYRYGITDSDARDIIIAVITRDIEPDPNVDISEFKDEPWAKLLDAPGAEDQKKNPKVFGQAYSEYTGKPEQAIEHLLKVRNGYVPGAFYKAGLGDIDLVWGNSSFGLQHIIERRDAQGLNGIDFAKKIPEIIKSGKVEEDKGDPNKRVIVSEKEKAIVN